MTVKKRLGEMLLEAGVIDETQLQAALGHQRKWGGKLGQALLDLKLATEPQIVAALSRKFGYAAVGVAALPRTAQLEAAMKLVPRELALRQTLLPVASDSNSITVAMADPSNIAVVDELSFRTGKRIKIVLAGDREIAAAVRRLYYADEESLHLDAIPLEELSSDTPFETMPDPFAPASDAERDGRPQPPRAPDPDANAARPRVPVQPPAPPPPLASSAARPTDARAPVQRAFTPPPTLLRKAATPATPPARATSDRSHEPAYPTFPSDGALPRQPVPAPAPDIPGEPILATELAPVEDEDAQTSGAERQLTPRESAMLDALQRAARGEESGLVKPGQLTAALARLLVRRGILSERELLDELMKK